MDSEKDDMKKLPMLSLFFASATAAILEPRPAFAWVDLNEWKKPKVFGLSPSADTAFFDQNIPFPRSPNKKPTINKWSSSALALYPILDTLVAGFTLGASNSEIKNIPAGGSSQSLKTLQTSTFVLEVAGLYAFNDQLSLFVAPGYSNKRSSTSGGHTQESFATLTSYAVLAASDHLGLGAGVAVRKNDRTQSVIPLLGGAWQLTPELRLDGWLPANVQTRWKYSDSQALFVRIELAGDAALSKQLIEQTSTDVQFLGAQVLFGWSIGTPLGFGAGFLRFDPSLGFFKGQLTQQMMLSPGNHSFRTSTPLYPLAESRVALTF